MRSCARRARSCARARAFARSALLAPARCPPGARLPGRAPGARLGARASGAWFCCCLVQRFPRSSDSSCVWQGAACMYIHVFAAPGPLLSACPSLGAPRTAWLPVRPGHPLFLYGVFTGPAPPWRERASPTRLSVPSGAPLRCERSFGRSFAGVSGSGSAGGVELSPATFFVPLPACCPGVAPPSSPGAWRGVWRSRLLVVSRGHSASAL